MGRQAGRKRRYGYSLVTCGGAAARPKVEKRGDLGKNKGLKEETLVTSSSPVSQVLW